MSASSTSASGQQQLDATSALLQQLFTEALDESDFATCTFAKKKLEGLLTYKTVIGGDNGGFNGDGVDVANANVPPSSSSSPAAASSSSHTEPSPFTPEQQQGLLAMLRNEAMFGTDAVGGDDDDAGHGNRSTATAATRLVIRIIGTILTDQQNLIRVDGAKKKSNAQTSNAQTTSSSGGGAVLPTMYLSLVSVLASPQWLGAADIGVGSSAASALVDALMLFAKKAAADAATAPTASLLVDGNETDDNATATVVGGGCGSHCCYSAAVSDITTAVQSALFIASPSGAGASDRHAVAEGSMRLLDALAQVYSKNGAREVELGNRIGLPAPSAAAASTAAPTATLTETALVGEALGVVISAFAAASSSSSPSSSLLQSVLNNTAAGIKAVIGLVGGGIDDADDADPLMLINWMNVVGPLARFITGSTSSSSAALFDTSVKPLIESFVSFIELVFTASPSTHRPLPLIVAPDADMMLGVVAPFILRGFATLLRNNSAAMGAFLGSSSLSSSSSSVDILALAANTVADPNLVIPHHMNSGTAEVVEAFVDFMSAFVTQKGNVMSELKAVVISSGADNNVNTTVDALCKIYLAAPAGSDTSSSIFMSSFVLTALLYPSKPVSADLKSSALLCVAAVISSPFFARSGSGGGGAGSDSSSLGGLLRSTFSPQVFNNSVYSHKTSLDDATRRACWHTLSAFLQHPLFKASVCPSIAAHLASLVTADFAESSMEVRRSQLYCCDLLLKMTEAAPFHEKLRAERRSGVYSKAQPGMMGTPSVGTEYAF